jgi:hypothetical protein
MTSTTTPRKITVGALKKLATKFQDSDPKLKHFECLNLAAREFGYENFNHASKRAKPPAKTTASPRVSDLVKCEIKWNAFRPGFPERVADLLVAVKPSSLIPEDVLQRLVFFSPEFWVDAETGSFEREHFRIDSAYFNRVTDSEHLKESTKIRRNVLSFYLLKNRWRASIFDYGTKLSREEMEAEIKRTVTDHIVDTLERYLSGDLEPSRMMSQERAAHMTGLWEAHGIERMLDTV